MNINTANVNTLALNSPLLADSIAQIADPPKQIYYRGDITVLDKKPKVAIVGSRKATMYGKAVTMRLAIQLAERGIVIVSGLALGIDSWSHQAALEIGGLTIAVLPSSVKQIYPARHRNLAEKIVEQGGLLVTEYKEPELPMKHQFIARNRLISGLSDAVLIPEAAARSGSLHTANFALEQDRMVMAVPGNINNPYSVGTNNLIKAGATPVTDYQDVLNALGVEEIQKQTTTAAANEQEAIILKLLKQNIADSGELQANSGLDAATFNQTLTMLEITGKIRPLGGGRWSSR